MCLQVFACGNYAPHILGLHLLLHQKINLQPKSLGIIHFYYLGEEGIYFQDRCCSQPNGRMGYGFN